jgi:hypothetical protein
MSVCLSDFMSACLPGFLSVCLPDFISVQYVCLSDYMLVCLPAFLPVCFSGIFVSLPFDCHSVSLSFFQSICQSTCLLFLLLHAFVNQLTSNVYSHLSESVNILSLLLYHYICLFLFTFAEFHNPSQTHRLTRPFGTAW